LHETLRETAAEDMGIILADIPKTARGSLLAKPYYVIDDFEEFTGDTALAYQGRAVLVYFYLEPSVGFCQVRKYRFKRSSRSWERYQVDLMHTPRKFFDSTGNFSLPAGAQYPKVKP
jgi:hypothetical protein